MGGGTSSSLFPGRSSTVIVVFEMGGREGPAQHSRGAVFGEFGRGPDVSVAGVASGRPPFFWVVAGWWSVWCCGVCCCLFVFGCTRTARTLCTLFSLFSRVPSRLAAVPLVPSFQAVRAGAVSSVSGGFRGPHLCFVHWLIQLRVFASAVGRLVWVGWHPALERWDFLRGVHRMESFAACFT